MAKEWLFIRLLGALVVQGVAVHQTTGAPGSELHNPNTPWSMADILQTLLKHDGSTNPQRDILKFCMPEGFPRANGGPHAQRLIQTKAVATPEFTKTQTPPYTVT